MLVLLPDTIITKPLATSPPHPDSSPACRQYRDSSLNTNPINVMTHDTPVLSDVIVIRGLDAC